VLVDSRNQRLENNLFPLLKNLFYDVTNHFDVVILTEKLNDKLKNVYSKLDEFLKSKMKLEDYHLSIVQVPPDKKAEHIRRVFTNYMWMRSENSLNIFKDNGSYDDKNNIIRFGFLYNDKNYRFAIGEIKAIKELISKVENRQEIIHEGEKIFYYPDKVNKLMDSL